MASSNGHGNGRTAGVGLRVQTRVAGTEGRAGKFPGPSLIPLLNAIQAEHGWLPREELVRLAREAKRPLYEIEGLISFYPHYRTSPPAKVQLAVCHDLSCWMAGAEERIAELRERYGEDTEVELVEVSCIGRCEIAPAVAVDERPAPLAEAADLVEAGRAMQSAAPLLADRGEGPRPNDPYAEAEERYGVLRRALAGELAPETIIEELNASGLKGMGGAGFPTGKKWELVRAQENHPKYAICNADESEPGTFKDRQILAEQPHLVLEGLLLAMLVCGAAEGWVFIRHEYGPEEVVLHEEIERLHDLGLLGHDVLGSGKRLQLSIFTSPGGYILGEETALIECMEGHRGEPRNKPPFPGIYGLHGQPTVMNSVETLAHIPIILDKGSDWWNDQGTGESTGLKFFSVSGDVAEPAVYCVPMGTTAAELIEQAGGMRDGAQLAAFQPGGASSNFMPGEKADTRLDFKPLQDAGSMLGSGALVAIAEGRDLLAAATNVLRFFRNESCGKCVPCRAGSTKAYTILTEHMAAGGGPTEVDDRIPQLEETLRMTSICGLGQVALGPVMSVLAMADANPEADEQATEAGETRTRAT